ncbi:hypothetical protein [Microbacterium amylolyticum]|uniref:Uncharacterized protein n=1 Tax=Microbacterium amylolyticum TaxID=936337 RepID=A0ABS4ZKU8_9MICO|nr:hypothetical protein [Microbacterium amylolyticum]MBP2437837.1 hypothetical protein [Microbacterium amylolyticum]
MQFRRQRDHTVHPPAAVPSAVLRAALGALVAGGVYVMLPVPLWQIAGVVLGGVAAIFPPIRAGYLGVALVVLGLLQDEPSLLRTCFAVAVTHAVHVLTCVSVVVPARARITVRALRPEAVRFLGVQLASQAVVVVIMFLPVGESAWWAVVGGICLVAAVVLFLVPRKTRLSRVHSGAAQHEGERG